MTANSVMANQTTHPEYNDWWVEREKLNAL